jgi:hypothetical protein
MLIDVLLKLVVDLWICRQHLHSHLERSWQIGCLGDGTVPDDPAEGSDDTALSKITPNI